MPRADSGQMRFSAMVGQVDVEKLEIPRLRSE
jgi:hypothetical protein